jgi:hypothetical protein
MSKTRETRTESFSRPSQSQEITNTRSDTYTSTVTVYSPTASMSMTVTFTLTLTQSCSSTFSVSADTQTLALPPSDTNQMTPSDTATRSETCSADEPSGTATSTLTMTKSPSASAELPLPLLNSSFVMRLSGSHWRKVLSLNRTQLIGTLRTDIGVHMLGLSADLIEINDLSEGSLIVDFTASFSIVNKMSDEAVIERVQYGATPLTTTLYQYSSGVLTDDPKVTSVGVSKSYDGGNTGASCGVVCIGASIAAAVGAIAIVIAAVIWIRRRRSAEALRRRADAKPQPPTARTNVTGKRGASDHRDATPLARTSSTIVRVSPADGTDQRKTATPPTASSKIFPGGPRESSGAATSNERVEGRRILPTVSPIGTRDRWRGENYAADSRRQDVDEDRLPRSMQSRHEPTEDLFAVSPYPSRLRHEHIAQWDGNGRSKAVLEELDSDVEEQEAVILPLTHPPHVEAGPAARYASPASVLPPPASLDWPRAESPALRSVSITVEDIDSDEDQQQQQQQHYHRPASGDTTRSRGAHEQAPRTRQVIIQTQAGNDNNNSSSSLSRLREQPSSGLSQQRLGSPSSSGGGFFGVAGPAAMFHEPHQRRGSAAVAFGSDHSPRGSGDAFQPPGIAISGNMVIRPPTGA